MRFQTLALTAVIGMMAACSGDNKKTADKTVAPSRIVNVPAFNSDSAYSFIKKQVDFGPRIPNSKSHHSASDYLVKSLKSAGAEITSQEFESVSFDGQKLFLQNIIASFYPDKQKRILLAAHWDTRPFSDKDKVKPNATFEGANDGASGVGILLEIARILKSNKAPDVGIDIILFDGEDWGEKVNDSEPDKLPNGLESWWCLGSQYWAKHKHKPNYSAYYGILLDMAGAKNAQFHREGFSMEFAPSIVDKVWNTAARLGYSHIFVKQNQDGITDDHYFVSKTGKIPTIDIVHFEPGAGYFGTFHHSQQDNMSLISKETLQAVGETVLNVVYSEEP
jgi:glutaminyl-peptide cyclotransferase